jgi:hypothetical protein
MLSLSLIEKLLRCTGYDRAGIRICSRCYGGARKNIVDRRRAVEIAGLSLRLEGIALMMGEFKPKVNDSPDPSGVRHEIGLSPLSVGPNRPTLASPIFLPEE